MRQFVVSAIPDFNISLLHQPPTMLSQLTGALCLLLLVPGSISAGPYIVARNDTAGSNSSANPAQLLLPAAPLRINSTESALLKPRKSASLFFAEGDDAFGSRRFRRRSNNTSVASLSVNQTAYPSVNLLQTGAVGRLRCSNRSVTVPFDSDAAFKIAASIWPSSDAFVLISYDEECMPASSSSSKDEHVYLLVQACRTTAIGRTLICNVTFIPFEVFVGQDNIINVNLGTNVPAPYAQRPSNLSTLSTRSEYYQPNGIVFFKDLAGDKLLGNNNINLYCYECRASGWLRITSTMSFSIRHGLIAGSVRTNGFMGGSLSVSMGAQTWSNRILAPEKPVYFEPLLGFNIPGILTLDPSVSLGVGASAKIGYQRYVWPKWGNISTAVTAGMQYVVWNNFDVTVDLVHPTSSRASGIVPWVKPESFVAVRFQTDVTTDLNTRLSMNVTLLNGKYARSFAIVEERHLILQVRDKVPECRDGAAIERMTDKFSIDFLGQERVNLLTRSSDNST